MRRALPLLAALLVLAAGCGGEDDNEARLRVVVPDNNIRSEGVECSGARPFRQIHRGTPFSVEDGSGAVVAHGELPSGRAENADPSVDWESDRMPTVCVFELAVEVPPRERYRLVLPETAPLDFDAARLAADEPLQLVVRG